MTNEMRHFLAKFINIRNMGYIKRSKGGVNGAGLTFEECISKKLDNCPFPDFIGIEIKVKGQFSKQKINLICIEPDFLFSTYNLAKDYGYKPKDKDKKFFYLEVCTTKKIRYIKYYFQLQVDDKNEKINLLIFNNGGKLVANNVSWSFQDMIGRVYIKLHTLAFITYYKKIIDDEEYYLYNHLQYYKNINFDKFIQAIKDGVISIKFTININTVTDKIKNHGTAFAIDKKDLSKIYDNSY